MAVGVDAQVAKYFSMVAMANPGSAPSYDKNLWEYGHVHPRDLRENATSYRNTMTNWFHYEAETETLKSVGVWTV